MKQAETENFTLNMATKQKDVRMESSKIGKISELKKKRNLIIFKTNFCI